MKPTKPLLTIALAFAASSSVNALPSQVVVCSYAPSQSNVVAAISGAAGGSSAAAGAVAAATGMTVVTHSSGALILTGSSGYIAGTIGAAAAVPVIVGVSIVVGGAAVTLELVCAAENHPAQVAKVQQAADEFSRRFSSAMKRTTIAVGEARKGVAPIVSGFAVKVKHVATDVWAYANRASVAVSNKLAL